MGEVVQLRDYQSAKDIARMNKELIQQAADILSARGIGIDSLMPHLHYDDDKKPA